MMGDQANNVEMKAVASRDTDKPGLSAPMLDKNFKYIGGVLGREMIGQFKRMMIRVTRM